MRRIALSGHVVDYRLVRTRRRTIGMEIDLDGLTVRSPRWVTIAEIELALRERDKWVVRTLEAWRGRRRDMLPRVWTTGAPIHYPASLNDISDEDFENFYHRAMDVLHKITGIDPESLRRNSPKVQDEPAPESEPMGESDLERLNQRLDEPLPELQPDQIAEQNQSDMKDSHLEESAAPAPEPAREAKFDATVVVDFFMKEAIRSPASVEERKQAIALVGEAYRRKFPSHAAYFDTLVHHCGRVAANQLRAESAKSYLVSIAPR